MTGMYHIYLELLSGMMLLVVAGVVQTTKDITISNIYKQIIVIGMIIAGFEDGLHVVVAAIDTPLSNTWQGLSWSLSRYTLVFALILSAICKSDTQCSVLRTTVILLIPFTLSIITAISSIYNIIDISILSTPFTILGVGVNNILDFILIFVWLGLLLPSRATRPLIFPPCGYTTFVIMGAGVHIVISFMSVDNFDVGFGIAHIIKLMEYYMILILVSYDKYYHYNTKQQQLKE